MSYECPYCPCVFVSKSDLELHLLEFGRERHVHEWIWFYLRDMCSDDILRLHGGADKVIRDLARIIVGGL